MSSTTTVAEFAAELNKSPATLIEQLTSAGVVKTQASDPLSESDKQKLLGYLHASHGTVAADRKKITLVKKSTSEIKQADSTGKARTIQVEVRKKRTFVRREDEVDQPEEVRVDPSVALQAQAAEDAELVRREEEASRHAELLRRQEEELTEKRRLLDAQAAQEAAREREREEAAAQKAQAEAQAAAAAAAATAQAAALAAEAAKKVKPTIGKIFKPAPVAPVTPTVPVVTVDAQKAIDAAAAEKVTKAAEAATAKAAEAASLQAAAKAKATAEFQADAAKAVDLQERRRKAEAEAAGIRIGLPVHQRAGAPAVYRLRPRQKAMDRPSGGGNGRHPRMLDRAPRRRYKRERSGKRRGDFRLLSPRAEV